MEKAVLVLVSCEPSDKSIKEDIEELRRLARTAGAVVKEVFIQKRLRFDAAFMIGRGKILEISDFVKMNKCNIVIFYNDLSQSQRRNIHHIIFCKIIDRTELILDIFAIHAKTLEAKLQVELAQYAYRLSHLSGKGVQLMQQSGGIGARGPGETKLEIDKRRTRTMITRLRKRIEKIKAQRRTRRLQRILLPFPTASLVGYTNAGKSTLMNKLTNAETLVQDKLFATLTTTTRRLILNDNKVVLITDTVGFIKNLPPNLIASFRSTLEEIKTSNLLIHIIDASSPNVGQQVDSVINVLNEIDVGNIEIINVLNKIDVLPQSKVNSLISEFPDAVAVSALTGVGMETLLKRIEQKTGHFYGKYKMQFNFNTDSKLIAALKKNCFIVSEKYKNNLIDLTFVGHKNIIKRIFKREIEEYEYKD